MMNFQVIFLWYFAVPPQPPTIFNERRLKIDSRAGPYEEGGSLEVTCVVYGGECTPSIYQRITNFSAEILDVENIKL